MKRPDKNYDWSDAVGKGAITTRYGNLGYMSRYGPSSFVLISKVTPKTVSVKYSSTGRDNRMDKGGIFMVEATEDDYAFLVERWKERQLKIATATENADREFEDNIAERLTR